MKTKIVAVVGPTAVGKSAVAVEIALRFGAEVLSCDSMQIYRGMDIGTAKITKQEMRGVPHHLIDIVDPQTVFSCADYAVRAREIITMLSERGILPVLCGGTGQYLDAVLTGNVFSDAGSDPELRASLAMQDCDTLWQTLMEKDPESAEKIHKNNKKRVIRALETYYLTGIPKSEWDKRSRVAQSPYNALIIGLMCSDRELLYRRIDMRVEDMLKNGLVEEARRLELRADTTAGAAIGYKELGAYLRGEQSFAQASDAIKRASRRYAKRQMTWFRANSAVRWVDTAGRPAADVAEEACAMVSEFLVAKKEQVEKPWIENI